MIDTGDMKKKYKGLKRIKRLHLVEKVTEELRNHILSNSFEIGKVLPSEGELGELLSVSRTVIREAMRNLQAQGLVEVSQGKRAQVKAPDPQAAVETLIALLKRSEGTEKNLNEVRFAVEGEIAALAAECATPDDIKSLEEIVEVLRNVETIDEAIEYDMAFHKRLVESIGNPIFTLLMETLRGLILEAQQKSFNITGVEGTAEEHSEILDEIKNHDSQAARKAMIKHIVEEKWNGLTNKSK